MRNHRRLRLLATTAHSGVSDPNTSWKSLWRVMSSGTGITMRPCRYTSEVCRFTSMDPVGSRHNEFTASSPPASACRAASDDASATCCASISSRWAYRNARASSRMLSHLASAVWHHRTGHVSPSEPGSGTGGTSAASVSAASSATGASTASLKPHGRSPAPLRPPSAWKWMTHLSPGMMSAGRPWAPYQSDGPGCELSPAAMPMEPPCRRSSGPHVSVSVSSL